MRISICACRYYNRISRETWGAVYSVALAAGIECDVIPDLCFAAAKHRDKLADIASCDVVLACQSRAVRAMLGKDTKADCIDIRKMPVGDILATLSLDNADHNEKPVAEPVLKEPSSNWVPWFPVIDMDRCVQCKKCVDFCMFGVYSMDADQVCVTQPDACKTDCPACARICPQNAIIFPKSEEELVNGSLADPVKPTADAKASFAERLRHRKKSVPLFKEDES